MYQLVSNVVLISYIPNRVVNSSINIQYPSRFCVSLDNESWIHWIQSCYVSGAAVEIYCPDETNQIFIRILPKLVAGLTCSLSWTPIVFFQLMTSMWRPVADIL